MNNFHKIIDFIKSKFPNQEIISLHEPKFSGREKEYVIDTINSTFVSSVGPYVDKFELMMSEITKTKKHF